MTTPNPEKMKALKQTSSQGRGSHGKISRHAMDGVGSNGSIYTVDSHSTFPCGRFANLDLRLLGFSNISERGLWVFPRNALFQLSTKSFFTIWHWTSFSVNCLRLGFKKNSQRCVVQLDKKVFIWFLAIREYFCGSLM